MKKIGLNEIVIKTQEKLKAFLIAELSERGYNPLSEDGFVYAEGKLPVMLTAHMDTVHHDNCTIVCTSPDGKYWMSPQGIGGDDRCGIYAIMKIIETHKCSVLFTEDEEIGCVGAKKYKDFIQKNPEYIPQNLNYIIEIDRKNADDAVFYDCDNADFEKFVTTDTGFKTAHGSCSDISYVAPALGVAAVNFSSGYYNPHQISEYINLAELNENIRRIKAIIDKPCEKFEYIEKKYSYNYSGNKIGKGYGYDKNGKGYSYSCYKDIEWDYYGSKQQSFWGSVEKNPALEDYLLDIGAYAEDYTEQFEELNSHTTYLVHDFSKDSDYEFSPKSGNPDKYYQDEGFNIYQYDEELGVMLTCDAKITGRKFSSAPSANVIAPYFNMYTAEYYYVLPPILYEGYFNYFMENKELYEDIPLEDYEVPIDDDIEKKDQMEEDIMKLYN